VKRRVSSKRRKRIASVLWPRRRQASRFNQIYVEYKKSPEIIRERMFLETMERVLAGTDKMIIDQNGMGQGVVPYLPLNELQKKPQAGAVK